HTRFSRDWNSDVCSSDLCSARAPVVDQLLRVLTDVGLPVDASASVVAAGEEIRDLTRATGREHGATIDVDSGTPFGQPRILSGKIGRASCRERVQITVAN